MLLNEQRAQKLNELQHKLNIFFNDISLLEKVFIHTSYLNEHKDSSPLYQESNEKLELFGDAVLSFVMIQYLYHQYPQFKEGRLSQIKSVVVSENVLFRLSKDLDLGAYLLLSKGEQLHANNQKKRILADVLEAFIGACYIDQGIEVVNTFILDLFKKEVDKAVANEHYDDYKTKLQLALQQEYKTCPVYETICYEGLEHDRVFFVDVFLNDTKLASGKGTSKKRAQQNAAYYALKKMQDIE